MIGEPDLRTDPTALLALRLSCSYLADMNSAPEHHNLGEELTLTHMVQLSRSRCIPDTRAEEEDFNPSCACATYDISGRQ